LPGPWAPCSEIVPELWCDVTVDMKGQPARFFRLRQW
jgi:hypothetical protein